MSSLVKDPQSVQKEPAKPETQKISSPPNKNIISTLRDKETHLPSFKSNVMQRNASKEVTSPPVTSPPVTSPPVTSPPVASPPVNKAGTSSPVKAVLSPPSKRDMFTVSKSEVMSPPTSKVTSPTANIFKFNKADSKTEESSTLSKIKKDSVLKEAPIKIDKLSLITMTSLESSDKPVDDTNSAPKPADSANRDKSVESNRVGDKIRKFEKAAEDASLSAGKLSRPGSVRGRSRSERLGSDGKDDLPPPATPFKDHVFFDLGSTDKSNEPEIPKISNISEPERTFERQPCLPRGSVNAVAAKWQHHGDTSIDEKIQKPEPQRIIKPEFKPMPSPVDVTIRSPSLGTKLPDQFPSQGTAFRNVAPESRPVKVNEDASAQNNFKTCILKKNKEKYSVSKGSSYFTRGSEEIWLVKKKDIEEIEERVLDSFRRAGGNLCMRSESMRPSSDSGQGHFSHATMGRTKRQMYTRSESLDPQWAGARAQTLKRQSSVACTCGHDKKTRAKSAGPETSTRPRSRSHGDDTNQGQVLDKYETLV